MSTDRLRSKLLRISNADRTTGENNDFTVRLKQSLGNRAIGVKLVSCFFFNTFKNIRTGVNNTFVFTESGQAQQTVTISEGHYTASDLFAALKVSVDAVLVAGSVAFTLQPITYKILATFTATTASVELSNISRTIGFSTARVVGATHLAENTPKLNGLNEIFLSSRTLASDNLVDGKFKSTRSIVAVVPNTKPFLSQEFWESDTSDGIIQFQYPQDITSIDLRFENSLGELLNIDEQHIKMIFRIYY